MKKEDIEKFLKSPLALVLALVIGGVAGFFIGKKKKTTYARR